ncbi:MAG: 3-hydroxyacyl-CoA dehydrogenase NAD-binding domain-containing protein [bacterium]
MAELVTNFYVNLYDSPCGRIAILTMDNGEDYRKPNTLGAKALESLNRALDRIEADPEVRALIITGKPYIFCVGADLNDAGSISSYQQALEAGRQGHAAFKRILELAYPTVAAINGACMGGGLEIALHCKYRTISRGVPAVAFPECFIGLVPGWGGTQLSPRLVGMENALQLIITNPLSQNRMLNGPQAYDMGLADRLFEPVEFLDDTIKFTMGLLEGTQKVERKNPDPSKAKEALEKARSFVWERVRSAPKAPYKALELLEGSLHWSLDEGFSRETEILAELIVSDQFKASVYSFDLIQRRVKKQVGRPDTQPVPVFKVGLIGAGLMASQLAVLFLRNLGVPVVMKDVKQEFLEKGVQHVKGELDRLVQKNRMDRSKADYLLSLLHPTLDYSPFADCSLVLEAVFEQMEIKQKVFGEAEEVVGDSCILATNTSSLSVTQMASKLKHPERLVGIHFFNPVGVMPLVEVIRAAQTSDMALATAFELCKRLRKSAVLVKDSPGFLVNRLLTAWTGVAIKAADEGSSFIEVDEAIRSLGMPMGPFTLMGLVGPAVGLHVNRVMHEAFPDRFPVSQNLVRLVEAGKKSFYTLTEKGFGEDPEVVALWQRKDPPVKRSREQILDETLEVLCRECHLILEEGVVASPKDIDTGMILGAGWPFFLGGITMHLDQAGVSKKVLGRNFHV